MSQKNVLLLAATCLLLDRCFFVHASVIIKTAPHANVKMEFGAEHIPPPDLPLLDESAKVDGVTRLGIEVPHSHNHRNVLIHKIGSYLTFIMKALAKTVAPTHDQDGKTHFDIHVDADLGEDDGKSEIEEPPRVTVVHSKYEDGEHHGKGDYVKAVVIMPESSYEEKLEEHKHSKEDCRIEHKTSKPCKGDSEIILKYSDEVSKKGYSHSKQEIPHYWEDKAHEYYIDTSKDKKEEKKDVVIEHPKFQLSKEWESFKKPVEEKKEVVIEHPKFHPSKEWESFKKPVEEKKDVVIEHPKFHLSKEWESFKKPHVKDDFSLQLDKSFYLSKDLPLLSHKAQTLDFNKEIKFSHEGKSLSPEEAIDVDARKDWKLTEDSEADTDEMRNTVQQKDHTKTTEFKTKYYPTNQIKQDADIEKPFNSKTFSKTETIHVSTVNDPAIGRNQVQTVKTTKMQPADGPVIVEIKKTVTEMPFSEAKAYNVMTAEPRQHQLSLNVNEIQPVSSHSQFQQTHLQQTTYSSDRSRAMTVVTQGALSHQPQDKVAEATSTVSDNSETAQQTKKLTKSQDESREVIMHLAAVSKPGASKKPQMVDSKKVKTNKADVPDDGYKGGMNSENVASRQESIRKLPMANIPTLIDVLQKSPPQEVERLTQLASIGTAKESQVGSSSNETEHYSTTQSRNITEVSPSKDETVLKSSRELQLPEEGKSDTNTEVIKGTAQSSETAVKHSTVSGDSLASKVTPKESTQKDAEVVHKTNDSGNTDSLLEFLANEPSKTNFKEGAEKLKQSTDLISIVEEPKDFIETFKVIPEIVKSPKSTQENKDTQTGPKAEYALVDRFLNREVQESKENNDNSEGVRNQKTFLYNIDEEDEPQGSPTPLTEADAVVQDAGYDRHRLSAHTLCSLTTLSGEARTLDISSPPLTEKEIVGLPQDASPNSHEQTSVEVERPLEDLKLDDNSHTMKSLESGFPEITNESLGAKSLTSIPSADFKEDAELKQSDDSPTLKENLVHDETSPQQTEVTPQNPHNVPAAYSNNPVVTLPPTTPSLPEKESMGIPEHKEREMHFNSDVNGPMSYFNEAKVKEVPFNDIIHDSRLLQPNQPYQHIILPEYAPETSPSFVALGNHDPSSPYVYYSHPKEDYREPSSTEEKQGMYGKPSPRVICVNTDTGKIIGDGSSKDAKNTAVMKYSPETAKSNSEDDKLLLLKLLHEDIQKLKQQLKIE